MQHLRIKYKTILHWVFWICLLQGFISDYAGFRQINYLCDAFLLCLLIVMVCRGQMPVPRIRRNTEMAAVAAFAAVVVAGWFLNDFSVMRALWGLRNYGRFFLFYGMLLICWDQEDVAKVEESFIKVFPVHMVLVTIQYLAEGLEQDRLSGLFGRIVGGNAGLLIYLSIVFCIALCRYQYGKISLSRFLVFLSLMLVNAALSELKFFFVLVVLLVMWYLFIVRRKGKGMMLALSFAAALYIGLQIFYAVFPEWANYLTLDNILTILSDQEVYATKYDIGRTAVFSKMTPMIVDWAGRDALFFGIGLGNGDYSDGFRMLNSAFFHVYQDTHYTWLSLGYLFAETGYLGTIAYVSFFAILEVKAIAAYQKNNSYYNMLGTFFPLMFMCILLYNASLRSNFAYMAFAVLTWQCLAERKER